MSFELKIVALWHLDAVNQKHETAIYFNFMQLLK